MIIVSTLIGTLGGIAALLAVLASGGGFALAVLAYAGAGAVVTLAFAAVCIWTASEEDGPAARGAPRDEALRKRGELASLRVPVTERGRGRR